MKTLDYIALFLLPTCVYGVALEIDDFNRRRKDVKIKPDNLTPRR